MQVVDRTGSQASLPAIGGELLAAFGVGKKYGQTEVLSEVGFEVNAGEIVALVGENGAGKSTLMKVVSGIIPYGHFTGSIRRAGKNVTFKSVHDAEREGIVLVPQELRIAPDLSIAENMFVGHLPKNRFGVVDFSSLEDQTRKWLAVFEMKFPPQEIASKYSTAEQRMMMIAGALAKEAKVLLLDEPTAALTDAETQQLFGHVTKLRDSGLGIVLITHRLDEVEQIADRVVVLRNGRLVEQLGSAKGRRREIVRAMIGRDLDTVPRRKSNTVVGDVVMDIRDVYIEDPEVSGKFRVNGFDLTLRKGEVHGLYGLIGAGRTELARALYGDWSGRVAGEFDILEKKGAPQSPKDALARGIAMLTEDRKANGILEGHSLATNMSAACLPGMSWMGFVNDHVEHKQNHAMLERLDIRPADLSKHIEHLSGGNQQKVLFARWLNTQPKILILDEPTLGVDIGARYQIYETIGLLAEQGLSVLMISSDVDEVAMACDRITVMYKGRKVKEFGERRHREELVAAATGGM